MEFSMNSTAYSAQAPCESSWGAYLDDFSVDNPSLVSDASSSAVKKLVDGNPVSEFQCGNHNPRFEMGRSRRFYLDEEFEDTATSPISSPKLGDFKAQRMNTMEKEKTSFFEDKERQIWEMDEGERGFNNGGGEEKCTELKKRGLCLVPVSVVQNYISL